MRRAAKRSVPAAIPSTTDARSKRRAAITVATAALAPSVMASAAAALPPAVHLFTLGDGLVRAQVVQRPSARNKSPYVGDVRLDDGRIAIAHMPSLDMGGKCVPGAECLLRTQVDKKTGLAIGPDATGKYGTPKCEFIMQLLRCDEPENAEDGGAWVGAHPSLGEKAANALLSGGMLEHELGAFTKIEREVTGVAGTDMRCDFLLTGVDGVQTILEVKTVVDTDYDPALTDADRFPKKKCVFLGKGDPYERAGIFPWGNSNQKGPDGEKVVSARAIKQCARHALPKTRHAPRPMRTLRS